MMKHILWFCVLAVTWGVATVVPAQETVESRQILQQYQMALAGESAQPVKCGFPAIALLHGLSPSDPKFATLQATAQRPRLDLSYVTPSGRFRIHYTLTGVHAVNPASTIVPNVPDYIYEAGKAAEWAFHILVDSLGFAPHADDGNVDGPEFDFYIQNLVNVYGFTNWEFSDQQGRGPAYIIFDNDFAGFYSEGLAGLRVTVAHEYFHAVQLNIRYRPEDIFFFEISSVWFEDFAYDNINDYLAYLPRWFNDLSVPLSQADGWHEYGSAIWLHYLVKRLGQEKPTPQNNIVYDLWQSLPRQPAINALKTVLESPPYALSFSATLGEFYGWCFFTGPRADAARSFDEGATYPQINFRPRTFGVQRDTTMSASLRTLAAHPYLFIRTGQNTEFSLQSVEPEQWRMTTITNDGQQGYLLRSNAGQTPVFIEAPAEEDTVVVTAVNANLPPSSTAPVFYDYKLHLRFVGQQELVNVLEKPYPNPLRVKDGRSIVVPFRIAERMKVETVILREDGQVVNKQDFGVLPAGAHLFAWNGRDESGNRVASGVYFFRLLADHFQASTKLVVIQ